MTRWKLIVEYDGGPFVGWQRQANGPSVQAALDDAPLSPSWNTGECPFHFVPSIGFVSQSRTSNPASSRRSCTTPEALLPLSEEEEPSWVTVLPSTRAS